MMDPTHRTIYGPVYLQFQGSEYENLMDRRISAVCNRSFQAGEFKVFQTQTSVDGDTVLIQTTEFLDTYLVNLIPDFDAYSCRFVSLFQLCPCGGNSVDPMEHVSADCRLRLMNNDPINDSSLLSERMQLHQRPPCVITDVNACYIPCPGCRCLFNDLACKDFNVFLICKDDTCQTLVARDGVYVFAATRVRGTEYQWQTIASSYGSRRRTRKDKDSSHDSDDQ